MVLEVFEQGGRVLEWFPAMITVEVKRVHGVMADGDLMTRLFKFYLRH
jgi:hypothetical protein